MQLFLAGRILAKNRIFDGKIPSPACLSCARAQQKKAKQQREQGRVDPLIVSMLRSLTQPVARISRVGNASSFQRRFASVEKSILNTDSKTVHKFYHSSAYILAALTPLAFLIAPSPYVMPVDITLGFLFPIHGHIGLNAIVSDYVPKAMQATAKTGLLGVTIVTILGLLKLNVFGAGMTESIKSLWRKKKEVKKVK